MENINILKYVILLALIVYLLYASLKIVRESTAVIVERLGKYHRTLERGINFIVPVIDQCVKKISLKEQVMDFDPQPVITKDNVTMQIDSVVYFKIFDPRLYTYGVVNPIVAIDNLTATTLRNIIGDLELDETLTSRDVINSKMKTILDEATDSWGIKVTRVELKNITPPANIQESMEKQMKAERDRRETILEAEGHKQAVITRKEGDKQAIILEAEAKKAAEIAAAEARARSIELVYEAEAQGLRKLKDAAGHDGMLILKQLEALEKVADGNSTKLIIPTDMARQVSGVYSVAEVLKEGLKDANLKAVKNEGGLEDECCDEDQKLR